MRTKKHGTPVTVFRLYHHLSAQGALLGAYGEGDKDIPDLDDEKHQDDDLKEIVYWMTEWEE